MSNKKALTPELEVEIESLDEYVRLPIAVPTDQSYRIVAIDPGISNMAVCDLMFSLAGDCVSMESRKLKAPAHLPVPQQIQFLKTALYCTTPDKHHVDLYAKEDVARGMIMRAADMGRVAQMLDDFALSEWRPIITINPATLRSFLGSRSKSDNKLNVFKRWGYEFKSEDEADAFAIGQAAYARVTGKLLLKREQQSAKRLAARKAQ